MAKLYEMLCAIVNKGVASQIDMTLRRKILYANVGALAAIGTILSLDIAYLWVGGAPLLAVLLVHLPFYFSFGMIPWMNQRGWHETAAWNLMLSAIASTLSAVYVSLGPYFYTHYYFVVFAVIPIAIFHSERIRTILFLFVLNMTIFFWVEGGGVAVRPELLQLSDLNKLLLQSVNVIGAIIEYLILIWLIEVVAERSEHDLEQLAVTDALTDLPNRRFFDLAFKQEIAKSQRRNDELVLAILDIDHFKRVNDSYGHDVGDAVLRWVSHSLRQSTRAGNVIARIGGEEFALLFSGTTLQEAKEAAERMRLAIEAMPYTHQDLRLDLTISIGLAKVDTRGEVSPAFKLADEALYAAKRMGRNRVVVFETD